jgi:large subunit ribosomal protein L3
MNFLRGVRALQSNVLSLYSKRHPLSTTLLTSARPSPSFSLASSCRSLSSLLSHSPILSGSSDNALAPLYQLQQLRYKRFPTVKRRRTHPLRWWPKMKADVQLDRQLTSENQSLLKQVTELEQLNRSPLQIDKTSLNSGEWTPQSKRTGLIARKLGVIPYWLKNGKRITLTLLQVVDNHVINCYNVEETRQNIIHQDRWKTDGFATITVGADSGDPTRFTANYSGLFRKAGVLPKRKLAKFVITEDAALPAGTPLNVGHFQVGQYIDAFGLTIDRGFEGVVKRWGFKGDGCKNSGATKAHRRPGSIAQGRKNGGPMKGRRMAGHMGNERRTMNGLQVLRINTKYGVLFVQGQAVPGAIGSWVYVFDSKVVEK